MYMYIYMYMYIVYVYIIVGEGGPIPPFLRFPFSRNPSVPKYLQKW